MKVYLDTSVLVAASVADHVHHPQASALLRQVRGKKLQSHVSAHGLAEFFAVLTRAPFTPPIYPSEAWQLLAENILPNFKIIALNAKQYRNVLQQSAKEGWTGGLIYDALHLAAARSVGCDRIYTFNLRHFRQLASEQSKIVLMP